jgi:Chlorophyllase enzyme
LLKPANLFLKPLLQRGVRRAHVHDMDRCHAAGFGGILVATVVLLAGCDEDGSLYVRDASGARAVQPDAGPEQGQPDGSVGANPSAEAGSATADAASPSPDAATSGAAEAGAPRSDASSSDAMTGAGSASADATTPAPGDAATSPVSDAATSAADYTKPGPYGPAMRLLNQAAGTVSGGSAALIPLGNSNDPSAFTLYFPRGGRAGETFPILTFGNGTFCSPTFYDEFIGHVVSYGYVVIAPNTSNTGSGAEMLQGVDWVIAQSKQSGSPLFGKVDVEHIGAFGHSQGGAGTCRAGADPRVDAIATLSGTSSVNEIKCPAFFLTTGGEAGSSPDMRIMETLGATSKPSMYGITVGGNHDEYSDKADEGVTAFIGLTSNDGLQSRAAVTAWFDWQLKGMPEVGELFRQKPCKFCNRENLQRLDLKGF